VHRDGIADCKAILDRLGEHAPAHLDLAGACFHEGMLDDCEHHARRALALGHPLPGLALNTLACAAVQRGDYDAMMDHYSEAARVDPQHAVLIRNVERARRWFREQGPSLGTPLELDPSHDFQLLERTTQPTLPGPLPPDFADWGSASPVTPDAAVAPIGSKKELGSRRALKLL
jgi:tetratricopeptide (TPR) repeat protein